MELDTEKLLENCIKDGIREGVKHRLSQNYDNPLEKIIKDAIASKGNELRAMLTDAISGTIGDQEFRQEVARSVRTKLAKVLVDRFGGELERQVNQLKSDPATRARITLAIEAIVAERATT